MLAELVNEALNLVAKEVKATRQIDSLVVDNKYIFPNSFVIEIFEHYADCEITTTAKYLKISLKTGHIHFPNSFSEFLQS